MKIEGGKSRLPFDYAESGMVAKDGAGTNFVIAGADKNFAPAKAKIDKNAIVVSSGKVAKPVAVRYAFDNAGVPALQQGGSTSPLKKCKFASNVCHGLLVSRVLSGV